MIVFYVCSTLMGRQAFGECWTLTRSYGKTASQSAGAHSRHLHNMRATLAWSDDLVRARIFPGSDAQPSAIADVLCTKHYSHVICAAVANTAECLPCSQTPMMCAAATAAPSPTVQVRWCHSCLMGA